MAETARRAMATSLVRVQAGRNYERRWALEWGCTDDDPREAYLGVVVHGFMAHLFVAVGGRR
jgi:hypothetical protein